MSNLEEWLVKAAEAAIGNERPALEYPVGRMVGLTVELLIDGTGRVRESVAYVERRTQGGALLGWQMGWKGAA